MTYHDYADYPDDPVTTPKGKTKVYVVQEDIPYEGHGPSFVFSTWEKAENWLRAEYPQLHLRDKSNTAAYYDTGPGKYMQYFELEELEVDPLHLD